MSKFDADRDASLIELYQKSRRQIECTGNSIQQKNTRRAAWEAIAKTINDEHQTYFTMEQCKKRWHNIKYVAKVQNTVKRKYSKKSESGHLSDQKPFASISSKVLEIREKTPGSSSDDNGEISTSPVTSKQFLHDSLLIPFSLSEPISSKSTFLLEAPLPQTSTTSSQHCYNNVINKKQKLSDTADVISKKPKLTMDDIREKQMEVICMQHSSYYAL